METTRKEEQFEQNYDKKPYLYKPEKKSLVFRKSTKLFLNNQSFHLYTDDKEQIKNKKVRPFSPVNTIVCPTK